MQPRIEKFPGKALVGRKMTMSLANNRTGELWGTFMQVRSQITNAVGSDLYSVQIYDSEYFTSFSPQREFTKWATAEVPDLTTVPAGMENLTIPAGLYAVFLHKGAGPTAQKTFQYIFQEWLPASGYRLDHRPHFEVLGQKYRNNHPESEEDIWIPVAPKS